jgi:protoporphyrinogen/coproporphyrinogen III oxidase
MLTDRLDGYTIDAGAQLFGSMYVRFLALVREIGLRESLVRVPGRDALWRDGRPHEVVYGSVSSMIASGGLPFRTKLKLGSAYVPFLSKYAGDLDLHAPEKAAAAGLDSESITDWGDREVDAAFVAALAYPQLGAYYGAMPDETSAGFYHILARDGMDVTLYAIRGGVGTVPDRLAELIRSGGGDVRTGSLVTGLKVTERGGEVTTASGTESFDGVVSAVPAPVLLEIGDGLPDSLASWLRGVRYRPSLSLALLLDRPAGPRYFGLSFPRGENKHVIAVAVQENKGVDLVPEGLGLLLALPTAESAPSLIDVESREVLDRMLPEIARAFPGVRAQVRRARVHRWPVGMPIMYPGYLRHLGQFRDGGVEGSYPFCIAGDYLYGPNVEGAVSSGLDAASRIAARLS